MRRTGTLPAALALAVLAAQPALADKAVPFLSGRVVDEAAMLPAETKQRIEEKLAAFEQRTGIQVAVLTVDSLEGEPIEDYSVRVAETWKLGQKGKDNGVLLLIAKQDRKMRIEVGYGLEPTLTDLESSRIIDNVIRPDFQKGDFGAGIEHGVGAILTALEGGEVPAQPLAQPAKRAPAGFVLLLLIVLATFSAFAVVSRGLHAWFFYVLLMPFYALFPAFILPGIGVSALVVPWVVLFPILRRWVARSGMGDRFGSWPRSPRGPWGGGFWGGGGGGGGGFGGFGGGGGGFSGGGGSFGGGGASGGW